MKTVTRDIGHGTDSKEIVIGERMLFKDRVK